jgi:hypothetical protein
MSRYTVMFETRIVAATSPTVRRRSPTNGRRRPTYHNSHIRTIITMFNIFISSLGTLISPRGVRTVTSVTSVVNPPT